MIEFRKFTLDNGLRVIHNYDPSTVMVAVDVIYNTGARDESRELTGIAHLFEHLMFGGSKNVAEFDVELENAGGASNAWTSNDFTNFYDVVPAANAETAFYLESDRMLALNFSREVLEVQRSVVIEEFKQQCLNRPYGDLMHGLRDALYSSAHPYSWPVIGLTPEHIARVNEEDVRNWFYAHYAPNNAVLAVSGNITFERVKELAEKWFGDIPRRHVAARNLSAPGFPAEPIVRDMSGPVPYPNVVIAIPIAPYGTHDFRVADCISDLLASGGASRLVNNLIRNGDGSIIEADASVTDDEEPGFFMMSARPSINDDKVIDRVAEDLRGQLAELAKEGNVTDYELERTLNRFEYNFLMSNLSALSKAQNLALAEMRGEDINEIVAHQRRITREDVRRVASELISRPSVTIRYRPA